MTLEQQLYTAIAGNAGVQALLAVDAGGNVAFYDKQLPQQNVTGAGALAYPAGVYQRISSPRLFVHTPLAQQASAGRARFQLTFWATGATSTLTLGQIDAAVLAAFRGSDFFFPSGSPPVDRGNFFSYDSRMEVEPNTQPPLARLRIDVQFWFQDQ